ncbi:MAG: ATP phosphoribosyltransferase regulatory subunit, partial [archaeon]
AELMAMTNNIYKELNIPAKIYINNRKLINEILEDEKVTERNREQIIRELDKLDKLSKEEVAKNLKEFNAEKLVEIFTAKEKTFEKYNFYKEIKKLKELCEVYGVEVEFRPFLARGLSYYNGTVFEIWAEELGVALTGGGSYLVDRIQSTGISFGLEPLFLISKVEFENKSVMVLSMSQDKQAINITQKLREKNVPVVLLIDKSPSKALDYANAKKIEKVLIIGEEEIKNKKYTLKNMKTGKEEKLSEREILDTF